MATTKLDRELATYEANREKLLARASGKFVLIKGDQVVDEFESIGDALKVGYERFGNSPFLVKQVLDVEIPLSFTSHQIRV